MRKSLRYREILADARRIVIKVGTGVLARKTGRLDVRCMRRLAAELAQLQKQGYDVILITSGAIGAGVDTLGMKDRPTRVPDLQMAAAVGQSRLMATYDRLFTALGCTIGQILLTHDDFHHKIRLTNARRTLENLLRHRVIPIVNENDVVADEEIKADLSLGDNDRLGALVAKLIRADAMIMLTTVDGLRKPEAHGRTSRVRYIEQLNRNVFELVTGSKSKLAKGGMGSKLEAAQLVSKAGCTAVMANGRAPGILGRVMRGEDVGTIIVASGL